MNRQCFASKEGALKAAIAQMEHFDLIGEKLSIEETNQRHEAACQARVNKALQHRELMQRLGKQIKQPELTPDELSDLVMGRK